MRPLVIWLSLICFSIILMIWIGGITRLTHSGLSIVEWKPIFGIIPPLSQEAWTEEFQKYQAFPQYKIIFQSISLEQFKLLFFWEYLHRLIGRLIGLIVFVPLIVFWWQKKISNDLKIKLFIGLLLGGFQGGIGWLMVKSGLVDKPYVSHYRLAIHFIFALCLLIYFIWLTLNQVFRQDSDQALKPALGPSLERVGEGKSALILINIFSALQVFWGALVAGLKAGLGFNTFPLMNGSWFPLESLKESSNSRHWVFFFLENPAGVQFTHRLFACILLILISFFWYKSLRWPLHPWQRKSINGLGIITCLQFMLGVLTLVEFVPLKLASAHQLLATFLIATLTLVNFALKDHLNSNKISCKALGVGRRSASCK